MSKQLFLAVPEKLALRIRTQGYTATLRNHIPVSYSPADAVKGYKQYQTEPHTLFEVLPGHGFEVQDLGIGAHIHTKNLLPTFLRPMVTEVVASVETIKYLACAQVRKTLSLADLLGYSFSDFSESTEKAREVAAAKTGKKAFAMYQCTFGNEKLTQASRLMTDGTMLRIS